MEDREPIKCPGWDSEYSGPPKNPEDQEPNGSDDETDQDDWSDDDGYYM